jgi:hypothetical protein
MSGPTRRGLVAAKQAPDLALTLAEYVRGHVAAADPRQRRTPEFDAWLDQRTPERAEA